MHPLTVILRIAGFFVGLWLVSTGLSLMTNGTGSAILFAQDFFGGIASLVLGVVVIIVSISPEAAGSILRVIFQFRL